MTTKWQRPGRQEREQQLLIEERQHKTQMLLKVFLGAAPLLIVMSLWWYVATRARQRAQFKKMNQLIREISRDSAAMQEARRILEALDGVRHK